jgi:hypothetical protein
MIKDSPINAHIILFLYKTQRHGSLYRSRDKQFQYVSTYDVKMTISVTERKAEEHKILSSPATRQRTSGVDRQHFLFLCVTGLNASQAWEWRGRDVIYEHCFEFYLWKKTLNDT